VSTGLTGTVRTAADVLPLLPADLLRALGLALIPLAGAEAGWPSAAVMFLVFGAQWQLRWLAGGSLLDWAGQAVLLAAGWFSVIGLYHRVGWLDVLTHAAASAVIAALVAVTLRSWLRRRGVDAGELARHVGLGLALLVLTALTVALGVLWEIAEWWGHHAVSEEIGVGYDDTLGDLTADLVGALAGSALVVRAAAPAPAAAPVRSADGP